MLGGKAMKRERSLEDCENGTQKRSKVLVTLRPECQYGKNCYRRSQGHFKEFRHPDLEETFLRIFQSDRNFDSPRIEPSSGFYDNDVVIQQLQILRDFNAEEIIETEIQSLEVETKDQKQEPKHIVFNHASSPEEPGFSRDVKGELEPKRNHSGKLELRDMVQVSSNSNSSTTSLQAVQNSTVEIKPMRPNATDQWDMMSKWEASCPYNFFLTSLPHESSRVSYSVKFGDLFHPSLGQVKIICHFNFMVEADWFLDETNKALLDGKETMVLYGVESPELVAASRIFPWLKIYLMKSPFPFGHHHTKMTLIQYDDDSIRFIISTANLIESDWENRTQGLWMSPRCPKATEADRNELKLKCPGNFKADLLQYLSSYPPKILTPWINAIRAVDCSQIKVVFVGSAPTTSQSATNGFQWGLKKLEKILKQYPQPDEIEPSWPLVMQCSSIATLGKSDDWIRGELGRAMLSKSYSPSTPIRIVYPSDVNVRGSYDGLHGGGCLPYSKSTHMKQMWIMKILHQWRSDVRGRSRAMPHIKTYCRLSPDGKKIGWFHLTSANLSKAAWGKLTKNNDRLSVMSWEVGVLFLPHLFGSTEAFPISQGQQLTNFEFILPYDVPLVRYGTNDTPWLIDTLYEMQPR